MTAKKKTSAKKTKAANPPPEQKTEKGADKKKWDRKTLFHEELPIRETSGGVSYALHVEIAEVNNQDAKLYMRVFVNNPDPEKYSGPTRDGLSLPYDVFDALRESLDRANEKW